MAEPFIAEIRLFAGNFAPRGWAFCDGQLLSISQNTALFSLVGTTYGGDGRTTFALPDLRGRVPVGVRQGSGLSSRNLGERGGAETASLGVDHLPPHSHPVSLRASSQRGDSSDPANKVPAAGWPRTYTSTPNTTMAVADRRNGRRRSGP